MVNLVKKNVQDAREVLRSPGERTLFESTPSIHRTGCRRRRRQTEFRGRLKVGRGRNSK